MPDTVTTTAHEAALIEALRDLLQVAEHEAEHNSTFRFYARPAVAAARDALREVEG